MSTISNRLILLPKGIVVERFSIRDFAADCPLPKRLGFNHAPSNLFFLLSQHSHLSIFHLYVVVKFALGFSSN